MKLQVGTVIVREGQFYLFTTGKEFGTFQLLPIKVDETREKVPFTPGMELRDMNGRPIVG